MRCPRCATEQPAAAECDRCGLIIDRWRSRPRAGRGGRRRARTSDEQIAELQQLGREVGAEFQDRVDRAKGWFAQSWQARPLPLQPRVVFFRELGRALEVGLPPEEAFACLPKGARQGRMAPIVDDLQAGMADGVALHELMRDHPDVFDRFERTVVEIAERAGNVGPLLESLARRLEVLRDIHAKTIGQRPLALMLVPVACLLWPLPVATILGYLTGVFGWTLRFAVLGGALAAAALWFLANREVQEDLAERLQDKKVVGPLIARWRASDFLSAVELCLRCRLAPRRAVTVAAVATGDANLLAAASKLVDALDQGKLLYEAAALVPELPAEVRDAIGDSSGRLSLAHHSRGLRKSFGEGATRLGRGLHLGLAALIVFICVRSVVPMVQIHWPRGEASVATETAGVKREDVEKAADRLKKMMPALKRADDNAQERVRHPGGGGIE